ncbi:MAG: phage major capsid protein [Candidatus Hydrogenedentes bacterium]|nr:phage major capsid protein [Candidatus Hydrogenedentota bacterium]
MTLQEMLKRRAEVIASARGILKGAEDAKRSMTETENRQWDAFMKEAEDLGKKIDIARRQEDAERSLVLSDPSIAQRSLEIEERMAQARAAEANGQRDTRTVAPLANEGPLFVNGGETRAFRPHELISEAHPPRFSDGSDARGLSLTRYLRGAFLGRWDGADLERRAMGEATAAGGGVIVPSPLSTMLIDLARNKSALVAAGAPTIPMSGAELKIAKVDSDPTAYWRGENQEITESAGTFAGLLLKAQACAVLTTFSIELLEDASFSETIENMVAMAIALKLDHAGLFGSGVNEPLGVWNVDGIEEYSLGTNGATPTNYNAFSQASQKVYQNNGQPNAVIFNARTNGTLDRLQDTTYQPLTPPRSFEELRKVVSNQIPNTLTQGSATTASGAFLGAFRNVIIGVRTELQLEASRLTGDSFKKMQVQVRGYVRADIGVARPNHLCRITGILE